MKILSHCGGLAETNTYLLVDESSGHAALIDAPRDTVAPLLEHARTQSWTIDYLLLTHGHWDHLSDHKLVTDAFPNCQVLIHALEEPRLIQPSGMSFDLPYTIPPGRAHAYLTDNQVITVGSIQVVALHTPGHAAGHICFHLPQHQILFAGDLIMAGTVGRYDFPGCDKSALMESLRRVLRLPPNTTLLPGHGPATLIDYELQGNPFIREHHLGPQPQP